MRFPVTAISDEGQTYRLSGELSILDESGEIVDTISLADQNETELSR